MVKIILNYQWVKKSSKSYDYLASFFFKSSKARVINLGVNVFIGLTVVFKFLGGPLILKLTPKTPSPTFFPIKISPTTGIFDTTLFSEF